MTSIKIERKNAVYVTIRNTFLYDFIEILETMWLYKLINVKTFIYLLISRIILEFKKKFFFSFVVVMFCYLLIIFNNYCTIFLFNQIVIIFRTDQL